MKLCCISGCDHPLRTRGYCNMHWNKLLRHGSPFLGEPRVKHGRTDTPEYGVWEAMIGRCHNPRNKAFPDYGGRGIQVCESWRDFRNFIADMGERPTKRHTLERNDNSLGYFPSNCEWATRRKQQNNTRRNIFVMCAGKRVTIAQAARTLKIPYNAAYWHLHYKYIVGGPYG